MKATRYQRSRQKGSQSPPNRVWCGKPSRWGNYVSDWREVGRAEAVEQFRAWLNDTPDGQELREEAREALPGKALGCWCPLDGPCHVDALIEAITHPNP